MKIVIKIFSAFFYLNSVAPAFMYYIYDENPNVGYVAAVSSTGPYMNRMNSHKKYFIGSNNQKYMKLVNEHAIDSHFTVLKTPLKPLIPVDDQNYIERTQVLRNTANSQRRTNTREDEFPKYGEKEVSVSASTNENLDTTYQDKEKTTPSDNQPHIPNNVHNYNQREYPRNGENSYEKKQNFVAVNERRAPVSKEQKVVKSNVPQFVGQSASIHQRMSGAGVKDKILHKTSTTNDRTTISRNIDMASKQSILNLQKLDNKKRETLDTKPNPPDKYMQTNTISDTVRNYMNKDSYNEYKNNVVPSRIGNHEELVDMNETPYALFYRMNPGHLDEQDILIENPLVEPTNGAFGEKKSWGINKQVDSNRSKSKRAPNVKIHKKVKNHTSYRNR
ncbi:uncharacterized protein [Epargyreus clarus]|uniref:uncharacterized protein n=1 Tax=Epargyreus clarus TaxID=520877 RepID=UPI003C2F39BD